MASQVVELEKEVTLLKEDLVEERHLKEWAFSKAQHVVEKSTQISCCLIEVEEVVKHSLEEAHSAKKRASAPTKEFELTVKNNELAQSEVLGVVEAFKKSVDFARDTGNHCLPNFKIYFDLVKQIYAPDPYN